jgi:hypothetical protein
MFLLKNLRSSLFIIALLSVSFFTFAKGAYAAMSADFVSDPEAGQSQDKIVFDFIVRNASHDASLSLNAIVTRTANILDPLEHTVTNCALTPAYDPNNFSDQTIHAVCDLTGWVKGPVHITISNNWGLNATTALQDIVVDYKYGKPAPGSLAIISTERDVSNGLFRFKVQSGNVLNPFFTDMIDSVEKPQWEGGTLYYCDWQTWGISLGETKMLTCDFSKLPPGKHTIQITKRGDKSVVYASTEITVLATELKSALRAVPATAVNPNIFNLEIIKYNAGEPSQFVIKVKNKDGNGYLSSPQYNLSITSTGSHVIQHKDFNSLPANATWTIELIGAIDGKSYGTASIEILENVLSGSCGCTASPVTSCSANPVLTETENNCLTPMVATKSCVAPNSSNGETFVSCTCTCVGTAAEAPDQPGGPVTADYTINDLDDFFAVAQNVIIAIAVLSGVFIIPYAFVLMSSGNPENIKKGTEWLKSIFWGYLIVFLAGALIRFVGGEVLSLGF